MQFDEKDLDNNSFSLEDSNSISWEDLLNTEEDIDLSALVKNDAIADEFAKNEDDKTDEEIAAAIKKEKENAKDSFDLNAATNTYVNSLGAEETGIIPKEENADDDFVSINQQGGAQTGEGKTIDDLLSAISDDDFNTIDDNVVVSSGDLSSVVDDELLNLLDTNTGSANISVNQEEILRARQENDILNELDVTPVSFNDEDRSSAVRTDDEIENANSYEDEAYLEDGEQDYGYEDEEPQTSRGNKTPVLLFIIIALIGLFAAIFLSTIFFFNDGGAAGDIMAQAPETVQTMKDFEQETTNQEETVAETETMAEEDKQAEELVNKVENSKQADETAKEEEKVVVTVPVTGRKNPFVPSSLFDSNGFAGFGADITMPPDGNLEAPEAAAARKLLSIVVSGIMFDSVKPSAILKFDNKDYFVQKGDRIDDYTVKQITKEYVSINNGSNVYKAYVGEAFNIKEELPDSQKVIIQNGKRQYISNDDIEISTR